jgi:hypothetical protein
MSRRIITESLQTAKTGGEVDTYVDKIVKYIPADIVAAWVAANGILKTMHPQPGPKTLWTVFVVAVILCAVWTYKQTMLNGRSAPQQSLISVGAFCAWAYALGGPFPDWLGFYQPGIGSLVLIAYTLITGAINPDTPKGTRLMVPTVKSKVE